MQNRSDGIRIACESEADRNDTAQTAQKNGTTPEAHGVRELTGGNAEGGWAM